MREIIFRGKTIRNKWVYGNLIKIDKGYLINHSLDFATKVIPNAKYAFALFEDEISAVSKKTIGQYTGLKDRNGKMIFEGDLLKYQTLPPLVVEYYAGSFGYWLNKGEKYQSFMSYSHSNFEFNSYKQQSDEHEVVGNIHDNPELVK